MIIQDSKRSLYKEIAAEGYDWRDVIEALQCSRQQLRWWQEDGRFPPPDGEVLSHTFTSMSRAYNHMDDGWLPETIEKVKPYIEKWRADYEAALKRRRSKKAELVAVAAPELQIGMTVVGVAVAVVAVVIVIEANF